jgi:hypothetical protein
MNVITEYNKAKAQLFSHFKYEGYDYGIEDQTSSYWKIDDRNIRWFEDQYNEGDDFTEYAEELRNVYRVDDLTMIFIYTCTGDKYLGVFDNTKEIK